MPGGGDTRRVSFMTLQYRALQVLTSGREMVVMMTGPLLMVKFSNNVVRKKVLCFYIDKWQGPDSIYLE